MSTRDIRNIMLGCVAAMLLAAAPALAQAASAGSAQPAAAAGTPSIVPPPADSGAAAAPPISVPSARGAVEAADASAKSASGGDAGVSEAELYFRRGVDLYKRDLYREALTEFNRALALDPNHQEARRFQEKANARLQQALTGGETAAEAPAAFEAIDPETITQRGENAQLSADEVRRKRVRDLLVTAQRYMEAERFSVAVEIYGNILLIDPNNPEAKEGLHKATIGAHDMEGKESQKVVDEDRAMIRNYIEKSKQLPEGADARGIKPFRFSVPQIEEESAQTKEKTVIESVLESPVSVEFEDIHVSEIVNFISDSWDVNIVIDNRAVEPPKKVQPQPATGGTTGGPPFGGPPGAFPAAGGAAAGMPQMGGGLPQVGGGQRPGGVQPFGGAANAPGGSLGNIGPNAQRLGSSDGVYGSKSSGIVPYINLKNVSLAEALQALLRPLGLDYSVQPGFIWISKPEIIRRESFEKLETRYYELRNAGSETLFKLVLRNRFGGAGGNRNNNNSGGYGNNNSSGGYGGGSSMGGYGGGSSMGGYGGGSSMGGYGGGSSMGGYGGSSMGGYGNSSSMGGYGGNNSGGYGGNNSGGGYGNSNGNNNLQNDVTAISNISDLFSSISDMMVGEIPATTGAMGLRTTGTGATTGRNQQFGGGGFNAAQGGAGLGGAGGSSAFGLGSDVLSLLERLVPQVYEPYTEEQLSDMIYNPANNMLIVKNTPTNLDTFEKQLAQIDVTPKQVSIEAKFLTVSLNDLKKVGFKWDTSLSDANQRTNKIKSLEQTTYNYDVNGDGVDEAVPFYNRPNGSPAINNTITTNAITALTNPTSSASPTFSVLHNILNNGDGDALNVTFDYLNSLDSSELLSAPRVTTMNRKPAVVADFTTDYFVTSVNTQILTTGYGLSGTASTNFVQNVSPTAFNFGIALSVTPQIRDNDQVRLWLNPEVRTKTGEKSFDQKQIINGDTVTNTLNLPTTSWQAVWTNVIVHDGDTLVLGGMVRDQSSKAEQKLPYIADIPVIGFFFKGKSHEMKQSSLLIFVTPDIIDSTGARFFDIGRENSSTSQTTGTVGGAEEKSAAAPAKAKPALKASGKGVNKPAPEGPVKSVAPPTPVS